MAQVDCVCSSCQSSPAIVFCPCLPSPPLLCDSCIPSHCLSPKSHLLIPVSAYSQRHIPGYYDRLNDRIFALPMACKELRKSLTDLETCIESATDHFESVIREVSQMVRRTMEKLIGLREQLEREIKESIDEARRTIYFDDLPTTTGKFTATIRAGIKSKSRLRVFRSAFQPISAIEFTKLIGFHYFLDAEENLRRVIPGVYSKTIYLHDLDTNISNIRSLSVNFGNGGVFSFVDRDTVLCFGAYPASDSAFSLNVNSSNLTPLPPMRIPRAHTGLQKVANVIYLFGGYDGTNKLSLCDKFDWDTKHWTAISNMHYSRKNFTPCRYKEEIFLIDGCNGNPVEVFDLMSELVWIVEVDKPVLSSNCSISFIIDGYLTILTCDKKVSTWKIDSKDSFKVESFAYNQSQLVSSTTPLVIGKEVIFSHANSGMLTAYQIDLARLVWKGK